MRGSDRERERESETGRESVSGANKEKSASVASSRSVCVVEVRGGVEGQKKREGGRAGDAGAREEWGGGVGNPYFTLQQCYCLSATVHHGMSITISHNRIREK